MKEKTSRFQFSRHWRSSIERSGRSPPPMSSPSICRRSPASETLPGSNSNCRASPAQNLEISRPSPTVSSSPPTRTRRSPASTRPSGPRRRRSTLNWIASAPRPWEFRSAVSSARYRPRWGAPTSTTSTALAAPGRSRSRRTPPTAKPSMTSSGCASAPRRATSSHCVPWPMSS
jgi:hypothetical protein